MDHKIEKYLIETTISNSYPDTGGIAGDDDMPPGNINFGPRYVRKDYSNKLTGYSSIWDIDDKSNFKWNFFDKSSGMEDPDNYHPTLKGLKGIFGNALFKHVKPKEVPDTKVYRANVANKRPEVDPKHAIGNMDLDAKIIDPKDIIKRIEKITQ